MPIPDRKSAVSKLGILSPEFRCSRNQPTRRAMICVSCVSSWYDGIADYRLNDEWKYNMLSQDLTLFSFPSLSIFIFLAPVVLSEECWIWHLLHKPAENSASVRAVTSFSRVTHSPSWLRAFLQKAQIGILPLKVFESAFFRSHAASTFINSVDRMRTWALCEYNPKPMNNKKVILRIQSSFLSEGNKRIAKDTFSIIKVSRYASTTQ